MQKSSTEPIKVKGQNFSANIYTNYYQRSQWGFWFILFILGAQGGGMGQNLRNHPSWLSTNYRNTAFWHLETGTRVADVTRSFGCCEQTIYRLQTSFQRLGSDKPPFGRPRITTPFEVRVIVTSTWRNRFMAAWKLLKFLSFATDTRISVCTARNCLRGARLIFELWNLNFNIDHFVHFWWRKWVYFQNVLLKMFTFVRHYMHFILSKVLSIFRLSYKIIAHSVCTD